ncbi:hypothetical protein GIY62_35120 (plasmid) [Burkholderia plantarii]|uniref:tetratricopeptide repeat protein n=1 Tax=Burkholderia plantarii TaxID=41899 RepID=UPI00272D52BA|nr:hypothetical protein [Burkholderia plantarii]WLE64098.1 hypothetical protein GIY62_35120 [Burkholderia plantarii]
MNTNTKKQTRRPGKTSQRKSFTQGKAKLAASSASTGGQGVTFENRAQAVKLIHMCLGAASPGIAEGWVIAELRFQARAHGPQTDDLVCTVENSAGHRHRVFFQMKSGLTARPSTKAFQDAIGGAWLDYQQPELFSRGKDRIVIVHDADGRHHMSGAAAVAKAASLSLSCREWLEKIDPIGVSNVLKRNAVSAFKTVVASFARRPIDDEELYTFLQHVSFLAHDLMEDGTAEHVQLVNLIRTSLLSSGYTADPNHVWSKFVTACMSLNARAGAIALDSLAEVIGDDLARAFKIVREASAQHFMLGALAGAWNHGISPGGVAIGISKVALPTGNTGGQSAIPASRDSSENKLISRQLDQINIRIKEGRYQDALNDLRRFGEDLGPFDAHQRARWYLMRGTCRLNLDHDQDAAVDFLKAAELCDDDDKLAAARVRGLLIANDFMAAETAGVEALERFPQSLSVWLIAKNAELARGGSLTEDEIPREHRQEASAFQLVAFSRYRAGDIEGAATVARKALALNDVGFFNRDRALGYTLEWVAASPLNIAFRMLDAAELNALGEVAAAFEPRHEKLWTVQSTETLKATVVNLGNVYVLLRRTNDALDLLREARARSIDGPEFLRLEIEAYRGAGDIDRALDVGLSSLHAMPADALVTFAQTCANVGKLEPIERAIEAADNLPSDRERAVESIRVLQWQLLAKDGRHDEVIQQLEARDLSTSTSIAVLAVGSDMLRRAGRLEHANSLLARAAALVNQTSVEQERYVLAMAYFRASRFEECAEIYGAMLRPGVHSELHNDLLFCYMRLGAYAKARQLLDCLHESWIEDDGARHLAMELGQEVGDWALLKQLSLVQLRHYPGQAMSWLFRLTTATRDSHVELLSVLDQIPELLEGNSRELTQIATCEMSHGFEERGLRRLYRMRRLNMADVDVAAAHLGGHLAVQKALPHLEVSRPVIEEGTYFTVVDNAGRQITRAIDPLGFDGLPDADEFRSASSADVVPFIGAIVGSEIAVPQTFDEPKVFKVVTIGSAYRRLLDTSHEMLRGSINQSSFVSVISLPEDENGSIDFSQLKAQIHRSSEVGRQVMEGYRKAPFTIGGVCRMMGRGVVDAVCGWPNKEAKLDVGGGSAAHRAQAERLLSRSNAAYVIDAATLIELGRLECLHALSSIPKLYCSTKTYALLRDELEESQRVRASGTAIEHDGELAIVEVTEQDWARRTAMLQYVIDAIDTYCEARPSYGPADWHRAPQGFRDVISAEEAATLALGMELDATLLCLDARLRLIGASCGLAGVWPQALLAWCRASGRMRDWEYSAACMKMFWSGRNFISLNADDLINALYQGTEWARATVTSLRTHLAEDDMDFGSALRVSLDFLSRLTNLGRGHFGFLIEVTRFVIEGLARHKRCPENLAEIATKALQSTPSIHAQGEASLELLTGVIENACARVQTEAAALEFSGQIVYCS